MNDVQQLLACADRYAAALDLKEKTASGRIFGDQRKLGALRAGGDIVTRRKEAAMQWLSDHWPEGIDWPDGVERPLPVVSPGENSPAANAGLRPNGADARPRFPAAPAGPEAAE